MFDILGTRAANEMRQKYLTEALTAVDGALAVYREGNAAYYVEKAERLRARIMAEAGGGPGASSGGAPPAGTRLPLSRIAVILPLPRA